MELQLSPSTGSFKRPEVYRRYEDGYIVREMTLADAIISVNWFCNEGIAMSSYDLTIIRSIYPPNSGFYVGEKDGVVIASAIRIPWSDNVFWGGMYYVEERHRGKGYGTRLRDQVAMENVGNNILCVDAMEGKTTRKNETFGYVCSSKTTRFQGIAKKSYGISYKEGRPTIVKTSKVDFDKILQYDNKCFVQANNPLRRAFLEKWLTVDGVSAYAALDGSGNVVGYGQRRPCTMENHHTVGPLYADNPSIAAALLQELASDVTGENISINISTRNQAAVQMAKDFQMHEAFTMNRMHVNGDPNDYKDTVFAITSTDGCGF